MRAYDNKTGLLSFSYHTTSGRGVFRVRVERFLFPALHGCSRRELCTLKDFRKLLQILDISDEGPEVSAFPLYYHLSRGVERLRARRDAIEPKSSEADKKIFRISKDIAAACKLSGLLEKYGYPVLTDGRPDVNIKDWIRSTRPGATYAIYCTDARAVWSAVCAIVSASSAGDVVERVGLYTGLSGVYQVERDIIMSIISEAERRGLQTAAA